jgi:8-amino-7-oxononanoate synthase
VPAIRYPTVARGQARLRVTITAAHEPADIIQLAAAVQPLVNRQS